MTRPVAFQGEPGAYSDLACRTAFPGRPTLPCDTFADAIEAVRSGAAEFGMLPCENSLAGRVPDIHSLFPASQLAIVGEHFQRIEHCLLAVPGATLADIRRIHSHPVALGQVRDFVRKHGLQPVVSSDTAGAARDVAAWNRKEDAAVASRLAGEITGLTVLQANIEDAAHNTTRFYIAATRPNIPPPGTPGLMTTFVFAVRNVPAALYKALGGFATNGVNMTKLESYMVNGAFTATEFMCDVEGHPEQASLRLALEELGFFSREVRILGVYPKSSFRDQQK
jgi:prephenate dehydratase